MEVFNLGVLGYSSFQGVNILKAHALALEPDLVVIGHGMNDASVAGYRDKDVAGPTAATIGGSSLADLSQIYRLVRYRRAIQSWEPETLGAALAEQATNATDPLNESFDYSTMDQWTRVGPSDYAENLGEMIRLSRDAGAQALSCSTSCGPRARIETSPPASPR